MLARRDCKRNGNAVEQSTQCNRGVVGMKNKILIWIILIILSFLVISYSIDDHSNSQKNEQDITKDIFKNNSTDNVTTQENLSIQLEKPPFID